MIFESCISEMYTVVATAWPDVVNAQMASQSAALINWREMLSLVEGGDASGVDLPFAIVEAGKFSPVEGFGDANDTWTFEVSVHYVASLIGAGNTRRTSAEIDALFAGKADALRAAMLESLTTMQPTHAPTVDWSVTTSLNSYFAKRQFAATALSMTFRMLVGLSSEP